MASHPDEKITVKEVEQRLKATLAGAFAGGPTQLKNIPKTRGAKGQADDNGNLKNPKPR